MEDRNKQRLLKILAMSPPIQGILLSKRDIEDKRIKLREVLDEMLLASFEEDVPSLQWIFMRDTIRVFRKILSIRGEKLAGFSPLKYMNDILHDSASKDFPKPSPGFFAELEHIMRGIMGKAEVYPNIKPAFSKYVGQRAAQLRSAELSRMARGAEDYMNRYTTGLEDEVKRRRYRNKARILKFFNATDLEWTQWQWQVRNIIRDAKTLKDLVKITDEEYEGVQLARKYKIPFGITPYYLSLMDNDISRRYDNAVRSQVIPSLHYIQSLKSQRECEDTSMDFMLERDTSPVEGITRRYPMIVILKPIMTCPQICVYCQRNWEIEDVYSRAAVLPKAKLDAAIQWIADTPEINEVLITGGDPFLLSNEKIENMLYKLSKNKRIQRIRIGTRTPVTLPMRITDALVKDINHFHIPGKREIVIITHVEHPYEVTHQFIQAVQKFRRYGISVYNQLVYTFYNSRKFEATALRNLLRLSGVTPYYTFNTKGKGETDEFRVPIARLLQEQKEEARLVPGTVRTDECVFNVPGLGKNYLRALQHHDVISILTDGRRVYEFHPWEKKLSLKDTYVYTDVSIHSYLQKLKAAGENMSDYNSIWYYY
ncbi:MAG: KamA family radical SAM protein [Candidatus Aminicenantes bacterium]|nr:KamA family radical SAM protein [Candidatus Aminicenantes bacterium]